MKIKFEKVTGAHLYTIFSWLREPHIMEFWDNTQAHKDDIVNFTEGRNKKSKEKCNTKMCYKHIRKNKGVANENIQAN
jgi:hypothetical protein